MIHVGLRADEWPVQSHIDLFEERVNQIVDRKNSISGHQIGIVSGILHLQFHFYSN